MWSDAPSNSTIAVQETDRHLTLCGKNFTYNFNKLTGLFAAMQYEDAVLLDKEMEFNIWRAPTDNDRKLKLDWLAARYDHCMTNAYRTEYQVTDSGVTLRAKVGIAPISLQKFLDLDVCWTISNSGAVTLALHAERNTVFPELPRFGLRLFLPKEMARVSYFGMGPMESYCDKHHAASHGYFSSTIWQQHEDYIRPQENGSHYDCDYVQLDGAGIKLTAVGAKPFCFNASHYTQEELTEKAHNYELHPCDSTVLCLDYAQNGIGSASCGPRLAEQYRLDDASFDFSIRLIPEKHNLYTKNGEILMSENTERRYLKWYNKVGYGSGDVAGNVVYAFLSSFVMIYLTDTVGLNPGIVGTLIAVSKLFDGLTDIFFGSMIDKTHSKLGKARPWMLYGYIGCAITLVGIFAIPMGMSEFAKYAWFFICYSLLNAVFYTANNIAYSALTSLVTKNSAERVEMGSYRFMFAFATSLAIQSVTLLAVSALGDTAEAWRTVAIIYAIIGLIVNTLSVFSVKELPEEEFVDTTDKAEIEKDEKYGLVEAAKLLVSNKYYLMICVTYILQQIYGAMISMGTYYTAHILGDKNLFGVFSWAINIPLIIALVFTPTLVAKMHGMYKLNVGSYALATVARALVAVAGYTGTGDVKMMLLFTAIAALGQGPWQGDMNAVIASCSEYTWLTKHKRVDGTMYSCTSLGVKLGGGLGTAITGWLLAFSNYDKALAVQPDSCINMLKLMYLVIPFVLDAIITFILSRMKVEEANDKIRAEMKN